MAYAQSLSDASACHHDTSFMAMRCYDITNRLMHVCLLQENVHQVSELINQQMHDSDSSKGLTKGLMHGPTAVYA